MAAEVSLGRVAQAGGRAVPGRRRCCERFVARGVPLTTASDAHRLEHVADRAGDLRAVLGGGRASTPLQGLPRAARPQSAVPPAARPPAAEAWPDAHPGRAGRSSHTDLEPEELDHLQRLLGSWGVLADLSFSDLLLLVPVHAAVDGTARASRPGPDRRTPSWSSSARCGRTTGPRWSSRTWWARR